MSSLLSDPTASLLDRIKTSFVSLKMPRAVEVVDACVCRLDRGEITALELVEQLPLGYDFSFQPSLDKARTLALAELNFVGRCEVVHLLGPHPAPAKATLLTRWAEKPLEPAKASSSLRWLS